jgi:hypothetical protein
MASLKDHEPHIVDLTQLVALAARSQATTHKHTSRGMEPLTDSRSAARTTHLLTACSCVTIIALLSDGNVAHVLVPTLFMRR